MTRISKLSHLACLAIISILTTINCVEAKKLTVYDRQVALKKEVDRAQSGKELTLKEADGFREKLDKVNEKKEKMIEKNGGKLSYKDEQKVEKWLNGISVDIQKKRLAKRIQ